MLQLPVEGGSTCTSVRRPKSKYPDVSLRRLHDAHCCAVAALVVHWTFSRQIDTFFQCTSHAARTTVCSMWELRIVLHVPFREGQRNTSKPSKSFGCSRVTAFLVIEDYVVVRCSHKRNARNRACWNATVTLVGPHLNDFHLDVFHELSTSSPRCDQCTSARFQTLRVQVTI